MTLAACRAVSVLYGRGATAVRALDGVDLTVREDERLALLGRSGSGKTTLLHLLGGLVAPTSGEVLWKGRPLAALDQAAWGSVRAHGIAYVFQGANLLPWFTAYENVAFAAVKARGTSGGATVHELLELVGLSARTDSLPSELSGGEAQRVALARALAQRPELMLCDEPTGHLDSDTGERMLDLIDALQREVAFALVIATHDPDVAARLDGTLELHDGRVPSQAAA